MLGELLLDTNVVIEVFKQRPAVLRRIGAVREIFLSSISVGELIFGATKSSNQAANLERIDELLTRCVVLSCNTNTARCYGGSKNSLRQKGRPIPDNDLWIAAIAMLHDLVLLTLDRHFAEIERLTLEICE